MDKDGKAIYNPIDLLVGCLAVPIVGAIFIGGVVGLITWIW